MSAELLSREFERLAEAPKVVSRLRRLLLDLAVRGLLVPQEPGDRSADRLIADIVSTPREVPLRPTYRSLIDNPVTEPPFGIPASWAWTRLGRVSDHIQRGKSPTYSVDGGPHVVSQKCVRWEGLDLGPARSITADSLGAYEPSRFLRDQDLLWNSTGTGTIGRVSRVERPPANLICDSHVTVVRCSRLVSEYVRIWLRSDHVFGRIEGDASGSTNQVELTLEMALAMPIPLPPLAEQDRIVAKVDELMALCDELEAAQTEREARRERLRTTSLRNLVAPDASKDGARFFQRHAPRMITRPEHVGGVRQAILDLAVRGRLVAHDAEETVRSAASPPSRRRPPPREAELELPFAIPSNWRVVPVQALLDPAREISYGVIKLGPEPTSGGVPTLRCSDVKPRGLVLRNVRRVDETIEREYARTRLSGGEVVINVRGTLGGVAQIPPELKGYNVAREVAVIPIASGVDGSYVVNVMASPYFWDCVQQSLRGIAYVGLNLKTLRALPIPLPPLAEQHRIVAKVDELMAVCDELEQSLATEQTKRARLLESLLHDALKDPLPAREPELIGKQYGMW